LQLRRRDVPDARRVAGAFANVVDFIAGFIVCRIVRTLARDSPHGAALFRPSCLNSTFSPPTATRAAAG
ncbi:MAG: hypothetical protein ACRYHA_20325, partial [Janthinobacterium lividum]